MTVLLSQGVMATLPSVFVNVACLSIMLREKTLFAINRPLANCEKIFLAISKSRKIFNIILNIMMLLIYLSVTPLIG